MNATGGEKAKKTVGLIESDALGDISVKENIKPASELSVSENRHQFERFCCEVVPRPDTKHGVTVQEMTVPTVDTEIGIPITIYNPQISPLDAAIMVYFHGGGYIMGSRSTVEDTCKILALKAQCCVVNVEYRLAPEHKFPACYNDAKAVLRWVMMNKFLVGGMQRSIVGVAGDSAGGNIAAAVCHEVPGIAFQVLIYPLIDLTCKNESHKTFANGPVISQKDMKFFIDNFLNKDEEKMNARGSPIYRKSFQDIPPALFIVAEIDPLKDDSHEYGKKIRENGIKSKSLLIRGVVHGFFTLPGIFEKSCQKAYEEVGTFIMSQL
ncbi:hydrolase superfamily [Octopus vulgaris]|uniref:Hydrolase superfamily n=2 Tax=Octopus TaxID=6643 RepID=A0AA36FEU7_OCTVU|nr:AB hydrolase superfamily protein C1039.03 [Octopus sinensis]CAI9734584.1 hydrolase superfamily [Octopus vulgaris]